MPAILLGLLAIAAPFILISLGELSRSPPAWRACSSLLMFVAVFAPRFDRSAAINRIQAAGLVVGLVGVALIVGLQSVSSAIQLLGALAILGAAASGALSSFVVKLQYRDKNVPPSTTTLFSLGVGAVLVAPFAAVTASGDAPGTRAIVAVIVLGLACTALTGSVSKNSRMNQYVSLSLVHGPKAALPNGSVWRACLSPTGGCLGSRMWRTCGSRRANEAATTRAICSTWAGLSSDAATLAYRRLRWGLARARSTSGKEAGNSWTPCLSTSLAPG